MEPVGCRGIGWEGWSEGRREGEVGTIILPKDGGTHPAPGDAVVQLEIVRKLVAVLPPNS